MMILLLQIALLVVLFGLSAFFSGSESALFSLDPLQVHRIEGKDPKAGQRVERLLSTPSQLLSAILIGNTLVNVAISDLGYTLIGKALPALSLALAIPTMTVLLLIFGEVAPKRVALHMPERISSLTAMPIGFVTALMKPLGGLLRRIEHMLEHRSGFPFSRLTEEEFMVALDESEKSGLLDKDERSIVEGIIRLEGLAAADIMTPRVDLVSVAANTDPLLVAEIARKARFKYLPIYDETLDRVIKFLDARRFLLASGASMDEFMVNALFVPEATPLDKLMMLFHEKKKRVACVVDEFGGTAGIVTQGDIAEEIIAESEQDIRKTRTGIKPLGKQSWLVGGDTSLNDVNFDLGLHLESEGASRIGGLVSERLERIPRRGDVTEHQDCRIIVRAVRNRRVLSVVLEATNGAHTS